MILFVVYMRPWRPSQLVFIFHRDLIFIDVFQNVRPVITEYFETVICIYRERGREREREQTKNVKTGHHQKRIRNGHEDASAIGRAS